MTPRQVAESIIASHVGARTAQTWSELEDSITLAIAETSRKAFLMCERIAVDYEKMTGEEFEAVYGCDDVSVAIARRMREAGE